MWKFAAIIPACPLVGSTPKDVESRCSPSDGQCSAIRAGTTRTNPFAHGKYRAKSAKLKELAKYSIPAEDQHCNIVRYHVRNFSKDIWEYHDRTRTPFILIGAMDGPDWEGAKRWTLRSLMSRQAFPRGEDGRIQSSTREPLMLDLEHRGFRQPVKLEEALERIWMPAKRGFGVSKTLLDGWPITESSLIGRYGLDADYLSPSGSGTRASAFGPEENLLLRLQHLTNSANGLVDEAERRWGDSWIIPWRYLIFGPAGAGTPWHVDDFKQSFWNAQVHGRKRWLLMSAEEEKRLHAQWPELDHRKRWPFEHSKLRTMQEWFDVEYPRLMNVRNTATRGSASGENSSLAGIAAHWWECNIDSTEIIYGPAGVWHLTLHLEDSIGPSEQMITRHNFVDLMRDVLDRRFGNDTFLAAFTYCGVMQLDTVERWVRHSESDKKDLREIHGQCLQIQQMAADPSFTLSE